ncbi:MAG: efflux RND transporter periplasmic adaptor subunit [Methylocystis sp.]|nr:efflux RND transporter periplasmic adaptor subunit [Methylocystis sp.]MCA3584120.1 efflux RND transporter periplasmic adaptor subunit [Methylocystis sp.]MCA3586807.1 efflux RND transporter periplasmic adaptor subunit [Methylocystis sp.]MCA3591240.1 efflux RND transporter periplasmic adaptor subunit [Methylocystis sp.]
MGILERLGSTPLRLAGFAAMALLMHPAAPKAQGGAPPAPTVVVAAPVAKRIIQWDEYTGRFEAVAQVEVRARVSGFVDSVNFKDGQTIKQGDLLFTIDPRPFELAVEAARAEVERSNAQVSLAELEVERAEGLTRNQTITQRDVDTRRSNLSVARAGQASAEANLKNAQLNLEWTQVRAPIAGRISDRRVSPGNLVSGGSSNSTLLTTIVSLDPIHFLFEASEADYLRYTRLAAPGTWSSVRANPFPVQVRLADETEWKREGKMDFVDNALNARSSTIRGRAIFDNADLLLTPGTFGRMRLFGGEFDAILIPDAATVSDQTRKIVFTVGPDNKVVPKPVTLGPIVDGLRVIRTGLTAQDKVIIQGLANPMVRPGVTVTPQPGEIKPATN